MSVVRTERETYEAIWGLDSYGAQSPGVEYLPAFLDLVGDARGTLLDAGTGSGRGALALAAEGFDVTLCDLTPDGICDEARMLPFRQSALWYDLSDIARGAGHPGRTRFDYVYCCDVLEHIPPQFTMLVIARLLAVTRRGAFLSIATHPDQFGVWVGKPLHQTVQDFTWWRDSIAEVGRVVECRDLLSAGLYWVAPQ